MEGERAKAEPERDVAFDRIAAALHLLFGVIAAARQSCGLARLHAAHIVVRAGQDMLSDRGQNRTVIDRNRTAVPHIADCALEHAVCVRARLPQSGDDPARLLLLHHRRKPEVIVEARIRLISLIRRSVILKTEGADCAVVPVLAGSESVTVGSVGRGAPDRLQVFAGSVFALQKFVPAPQQVAAGGQAVPVVADRRFIGRHFKSDDVRQLRKLRAEAAPGIFQRLRPVIGIGLGEFSIEFIPRFSPVEPVRIRPVQIHADTETVALRLADDILQHAEKGRVELSLFRFELLPDHVQADSVETEPGEIPHVPRPPLVQPRRVQRAEKMGTEHPKLTAVRVTELFCYGIVDKTAFFGRQRRERGVDIGICRFLELLALLPQAVETALFSGFDENRVFRQQPPGGFGVKQCFKIIQLLALCGKHDAGPETGFDLLRSLSVQRGTPRDAARLERLEHRLLNQVQLAVARQSVSRGFSGIGKNHVHLQYGHLLPGFTGDEFDRVDELPILFRDSECGPVEIDELPAGRQNDFPRLPGFFCGIETFFTGKAFADVQRQRRLLRQHHLEPEAGGRRIDRVDKTEAVDRPSFCARFTLHLPECGFYAVHDGFFETAGRPG